MKAKPKKQTSGSMVIKNSGFSDTVKKIKKLENGSEKVIKATINDFKSRAPAWISKGIKEIYGVDNIAIKEAEGPKKRGKTSIRVKGNTIDSIQLVYRGRTLTPTHFKMSPKLRPKKFKKNIIKIPGKAIGINSEVASIKISKPYTIKATIIKGQRSELPAGTFLAKPKNKTLPFQRTTKERKPIEAIRTLSVPQMIDGRANEAVKAQINTNLIKRLEHNFSRLTR